VSPPERIAVPDRTRFLERHEHRVLRVAALVGLVERQMLWWTTNGFMKRTIPLRSIVDTSFVDEAAKAVPEQ